MNLKGWMAGLNSSFMFNLPSFEAWDGILIPFHCPEVPDFQINRLFYICGVPDGAVRANHACMNAAVILIAASGSVKVSVETENLTQEYSLDSNQLAVFIPEASWVRAYSFSENAVLLGLSDKKFTECDYLDEYSEYKTIVRKDI